MTTSHQHDQTGTTDPADASSDAAVLDLATDSGPTHPSGDEVGSAGSVAGSDRRESRPAGPVDLEKEGEIAADYLEDLLDIADLDGDIDMDVERDRALVSVVGGDLDHLVGRNGTVLEALQELTRLAVHAQTGARSRLMLDVGGYRAGRKAVLSELGRTTAETVRSTGEKVRLEPMSPFERKVVHDAVAEAGLTSESEGEEPHRRVVVLPA
jgi:spoIIIJ-associated protein